MYCGSCLRDNAMATELKARGHDVMLLPVYTPTFTDVDAVRLADVLGTGMAGVLWTVDQTPVGGGNFQFMDLTGGLKPYLLTEMDNHRGAITRVQYLPSTRFYLEDVENPETRWKTLLPFPVQIM